MKDFKTEAEELRELYAKEFGVCFSISSCGYFGSFHRWGSNHSFCNEPPINNETKGRGKEALLLLCRLADKHGIVLGLFCNQQKCMELYQDCDFKITNHYKSGDYNRWEMERRPNGSASSKYLPGSHQECQAEV